MKIMTLAAAAAIASCSNPSVLGIDNGFDGTWRDVVDVKVNGITHKYPVAVAIKTNGDTATIIGLCPDPSAGGLTAIGDGRRLSWSGRSACRPNIVSCPGGSIEYTSVDAELFDGGRLQIVAHATVDMCENDGDGVVEFYSNSRELLPSGQ